MGDLADLGRRVVSLLELGELEEVLVVVAAEVRQSTPPGVLAQWGPGVEGAIGGERSIVGVEEVDDRRVDVELSGDRGRLAVTVCVDEEGKVVALGVGARIDDGVRNIVIGCPVEPDAGRRLADFYARVLGMRIVREDWLKVGTDLATFPHLAFGDGWSDERPPLWDDPAYSHQVHLEAVVADLDATVSLVVEFGGSVLGRDDQRLVVADPFGHPLYLRPEGHPSGLPDGAGKLVAVGLQCADPDELAAFWSELLGMGDRRQDSPDRVVIASRSKPLMLAFDRVPNYVSPRWQDRAFPAQAHLDLHFNDPVAARHRAEELGAVPLPPPRGSCPVYADPAGHPFCLCSSGGGESVPYLAVIGH